jgi:hypothetical protein
VRAWLYRLNFDKRIANSNDPKDVFEKIYKTNWWQSAESVSGPGSDMAFTAEFRVALEDWLARHSGEVKVFLDAPCGDFNWMRHVPLPEGTTYIGGDIVADLIAGNVEKYTSPRHRFMTLDIVEDIIPSADAWMCRDVLFHLPLAMGKQVVEAFQASDAKYFLSTTYPDAKNDSDIKVGWFRAVNLSLAPFDLGEPIELLPDNGDGVTNRFVGVWRNKRLG